jgi:hypothetical protein
MIRRLCVVLLCAVAPIGVVTGCGGGSSTTSTKHATARSKTSSASLSAGLAKAIRACKKEVRTSAYIPAAEKPTAETDCEGVKSGDAAKVAALRTILENACEQEVIAKVPASEKVDATAACKKV